MLSVPGRWPLSAHPRSWSTRARFDCLVATFGVLRPSAELWYNVREAFATAGPFRGGSRCTLLRRSPGVRTAAW